jgi:hypothetical protein
MAIIPPVEDEEAAASEQQRVTDPPVVGVLALTFQQPPLLDAELDDVEGDLQVVARLPAVSGPALFRVIGC